MGVVNKAKNIKAKVGPEAGAAKASNLMDKAKQAVEWAKENPEKAVFVGAVVVGVFAFGILTAGFGFAVVAGAGATAVGAGITAKKVADFVAPPSPTVNALDVAASGDQIIEAAKVVNSTSRAKLKKDFNAVVQVVDNKIEQNTNEQRHFVYKPKVEPVKIHKPERKSVVTGNLAFFSPNNPPRRVIKGRHHAHDLADHADIPAQVIRRFGKYAEF